MICQNSPIHFHALLFQNIVSHWCFWRRIYEDIFTCSQLPGLQKPSLLVLKSENVLVAQDPTTTTATRERHQKSKRFNMQNNIFACAPYLFCHFFHDYDAKISCFMKDENQQLRICLSLSELGQSKLLGDLLPAVAVLVSYSLGGRTLKKSRRSTPYTPHIWSDIAKWQGNTHRTFLGMMY